MLLNNYTFSELLGVVYKYNNNVECKE